MAGINNTDNILHTLFILRHRAKGNAVFVVVCAIIGVVAGVAASLLKYLTAEISHAAVGGLTSDGQPWRLLFLPVAGIILAGCFQRYLLRRNLDHGTDRINEALTSRNHLLPWSAAWGTIAGASLTLGLGGSAGAEGPIAYSGATIGSRVARWLKMPPQQMAAMVAIGAGAGIAGIFRAPVGGLMFAIEVLSFSFTTISVLGVATACIASGITAYALGGFAPDLVFNHIPEFDPALVAWAVPLGILCGVYSIYYSRVMNSMTARLERARHPWLKWLVSGGSIALMVFTLPALYGEGYATISILLDGDGAAALSYGSWLSHIPGVGAAVMPVLLSGAVILLKAPAAASTNSGGGVAGDFAPTIFAGACAGFFAASVLSVVTTAEVPVAALVFMAMGGVMSGAVRAPLMAMFLVAEMTGAFCLFMPLALTSALSFAVVWAYDRLKQKGDAVNHKGGNPGQHGVVDNGKERILP